jgi:hypothetical protein
VSILTLKDVEELRIKTLKKGVTILLYNVAHNDSLVLNQGRLIFFTLKGHGEREACLEAGEDKYTDKRYFENSIDLIKAGSRGEHVKYSLTGEYQSCV